jgi:hypothetical protein
MTRCRWLVGIGLVALLVVFVIVKFILPSSGGRIAGGISDGPFGPFAGYVWIGQVHSVSASFTVPVIASPSAISEAGTWIGAQGQGPPARFVQIGAVESRFWSRQKHATVDEYATFWSDTALQFKPKILFVVSPGDALSASLTLANERWTLTIIDSTSRQKTHFSIGNEVDGSFDQAEWTQEDPGRPYSHARYPQIAAPVFRNLTVDSVQPAPVYSSWMSVNHGTFAPTVMRDDSFTLEPAPPVGPAGAQYVRVTAATAASFQEFESKRATWTPTTPYVHIVNAYMQLVQATQKLNRAMLTARWTKQITGLVRASARANSALLRKAQPPAILTATTFAAWNFTLTGASERAVSAGGKLRLALGLPGVGRAGSAVHL